MSTDILRMDIHSTSLHNTLPRSKSVKIKDQEIFKIKLALSSLTNSVVLCPMIATLYTQSPTDDETWTCCKRGVPVIILNFDKDKEVVSAQLCIADPDSGFALWRETLHDTSDYKATQKNFHTFKLSSEGNCMAGIRFPLDEGANIFLRDVLLNIPKVKYESMMDVSARKKSKGSRKSSTSNIRKKISKEEISKPCMFTHVTSATVVNKTHDSKSQQKCRHLKTKANKYSGSGSSLDHPDADPVQNMTERRSVIVNQK